MNATAKNTEQARHFFKGTPGRAITMTACPTTFGWRTLKNTLRARTPLYAAFRE